MSVAGAKNLIRANSLLRRRSKSVRARVTQSPV
jgi:hypothetical protein